MTRVFALVAVTAVIILTVGVCVGVVQFALDPPPPLIVGPDGR